MDGSQEGGSKWYVEEEDEDDTADPRPVSDHEAYGLFLQTVEGVCAQEQYRHDGDTPFIVTEAGDPLYQYYPQQSRPTDDIGN